MAAASIMLRQTSHVLARLSWRRALQHDDRLPAELAARLWADPHELLSTGKTLQAKRCCNVVRIEYDGQSYVLKHYDWGSRGRTIKKCLSRSRARTTWTIGRYLLAAGIPTPSPRAIVEERIGPFRRSSFLLMDYVPGDTLYRHLRYQQLQSNEVQDLAKQCARIWQQLDDARALHSDLKPENMLVDPQGRLWLIDLDQTRRYPRLDKLRRKQIRDARELLLPRGWRKQPDAAEVFRQAMAETAAGRAVIAQFLNHPLARVIRGDESESELLTVEIVCNSESISILGCLESVRDFADEIVVVDTGMNESTRSHVQQAANCRIVRQTELRGAELENWARCQAKHPWVLRLAPQERVNPALARQIHDATATKAGEDAFRFQMQPRVSKPEPLPMLRLYRKEAVHFESHGGRVELIVPSGKINTLPSLLWIDPQATNERTAMLRESGLPAVMSARTSRAT